MRYTCSTVSIGPHIVHVKYVLTWTAISFDDELRILFLWLIQSTDASDNDNRAS